jgi:hypothetical protein
LWAGDDLGLRKAILAKKINWGEIMSWIPGWESIQATGWWSGFYFWASITSLIGLGISEVASHRYSERRDELMEIQQRDEKNQHDDDMARLHLETSKANAETAKANEAAARANERAAELKLELDKEVAARQPRHLTPEQKATVVEALRNSPKGKVFVVSSFFDAEARQFGAEIEDALRASGYEVKEIPQDRPQRPIGYTSPGAWLWVHNLNDPDGLHAKPIQDAFKAAGLYLDGQAHPDLLEAGEVMIAVSSHP